MDEHTYSTEVRKLCRQAEAEELIIVLKRHFLLPMCWLHYTTTILHMERIADSFDVQGGQISDHISVCARPNSVYAGSKRFTQGKFEALYSQW